MPERHVLARKLWLICYYGFARHLPRQVGGGALRVLVGRKLLDRLGDGAEVHEGVHIGSGIGLSLGPRSYLGRRTFVGLGGIVMIGSDVMIGPEVMILTGVHGTDSGSHMIDQESTSRDIAIGDDVWLGARTIVLPGVRIGTGSIVGAGSVVSRDIPDRVVAVGAPARPIRNR